MNLAIKKSTGTNFIPIAQKSVLLEFVQVVDPLNSKIAWDETHHYFYKDWTPFTCSHSRTLYNKNHRWKNIVYRRGFTNWARCNSVLWHSNRNIFWRTPPEPWKVRKINENGKKYFVSKGRPNFCRPSTMLICKHS